MFQFIRAVIQAVLKLLAGAVQTVWDMLEEVGQAAWKSGLAILSIPERIFGGGGHTPAPPIPDLAKALPDPGQITQARDLARGHAKAVAVMEKTSPALQAQVFAAASEDERMSVDLSLLTPAQFDWLHSLNNKQLKAIAEATHRRVAAALAGERQAIIGMRSVGEPDPDKETALSARIAAYRAGTLAPAPSTYAFN